MKYSFNHKNILFATLLGGLFVGGLLFPGCGSSEPTVEVQPHSSTSNALSVNEVTKNTKVKIANLAKKNVQHKIDCTGMVDLPPTELVFVHSRTSGFVKKLKYIPGDYVKKGSLLATIENPKLIEEQRMWMEAKAELDYAKIDFERVRQLKESNATSEKKYQEALARKNKLEATYSGLKSELVALGINISRLEQEGVFQSSISVFASTSGYVHSVDVNLGQMIQPENKLMEIANKEHMHLELNVLSKDAPFVQKGQKVQFVLPSGDKVYEAEVVKINPLIDPETNTMNVHCHIEEHKDPAIKPGVFANAKINGAASSQTGLPTDAVIKQGDLYFAFRVVGDEVKKELLKNPSVHSDWVTFSNSPEGQWVVAGAYYLDGGE